MTNHRYRDTDREFRTATDAQLAQWEAAQPNFLPNVEGGPKRLIPRRHSLVSELKDLAGAILLVFVLSFIGGVIVFGQLQGAW